jgi:hypothetical protein
VALWIDNERGSHEYWREVAQECLADAPNAEQFTGGVWTEEQAARYNLADRLKDEITEGAPEVGGMYGDLLGAALDDVNWDEIAGGMVEAARDEQAAEQATEQATEQADAIEAEASARRVREAKTGKRIGRAMARDVLSGGLSREWTGLDPQDVDQIPFGGDRENVERIARDVYTDMVEAERVAE